jgi:hypothetical protein
MELNIKKLSMSKLTKPTLLTPDELVLYIYDNKISITHICEYANQSTLFFHNKLKARDKPKEFKDIDKPFYYSHRLTDTEIKTYKHNNITLALFRETVGFLLRILQPTLPLVYQAHIAMMCNTFYKQVGDIPFVNGAYTLEQLEDRLQAGKDISKKTFKANLKKKDDPKVKLELVKYMYENQGHRGMLNPVRSEKEGSKRLELNIDGYVGNIAITRADLDAQPDLEAYLYLADILWVDEKPEVPTVILPDIEEFVILANEPTDEELEWTEEEQREVTEREKEASMTDEEDRLNKLKDLLKMPLTSETENKIDKWLGKAPDKPALKYFDEQRINYASGSSPGKVGDVIYYSSTQKGMVNLTQQQEQTAKRKLSQGNRSSIISELITQELELIDKLDLQISEINDKLSSLNDELFGLGLEKHTTQKKIEALQTVQNLYN